MSDIVEPSGANLEYLTVGRSRLSHPNLRFHRERPQWHGEFLNSPENPRQAWAKPAANSGNRPVLRTLHLSWILFSATVTPDVGQSAV